MVLQTWVVVAASIAYLGILFAVAFYGDRRADSGRSVINSGTTYALSLAVFATSWTYYGSVGRAAVDGSGFLTTYLGPTLMMALGWLVLRRIIRISKRNRITSMADFISARYGKSSSLGGLVTIIAAIGIVPYIALQLKAVSATFEIIRGQPTAGHVPMFQDTALYVALLLAGFTILFGTRHLDATERHEGMVAAIAFESVVKLVAFVAAGIFVTFGLYGGFGDLFSQAAQANLSTLFTLGEQTGTWAWLIVLAALASLLLPRQWQIGVVENVDERHLKRAMWLFPLYLLIINIFVLPIAAGGLLRLGSEVNPDTYVLTLPMDAGQGALTLLVFIGGLSAATGMIIVEMVALSTMVSNSLVMPALLRGAPKFVQRRNLAKLILFVRRATIVLVMLAGYAFFRFAGEGSALVSIGLVSFAAMAQFAPAVLGGLFWKGGTRDGALVGLVAGFTVWAYTLLLPAWLSDTFLRDGPFGISALRPQQLFGIGGMDSVSHAMFWSMLVNIGGYVCVSLIQRPNVAERAQAVLFVDALADPAEPRAWHRAVTIGELRSLLERFGRTIDGPSNADADPEQIRQAETELAGSIGTASARIMIASVAGEERLGVEEVMEMIDEASQVATLEERHRLARELHDSVSQALFSMTLYTRAVELAAQKEGADPDGPVARGLAELRKLTQGALAEMRGALFQLRPDTLHEEGLVSAIRKGASAIAVRENLRVEVIAPEERLPLSAFREEELFRVVQEAMHNCVKHASPSRIEVRLSLDGDLLIEVADDGTGFDPSAPHIAGLGLTGMRERMRRIGGRLVIDSHPDGPTTVRLVVPDAMEIQERAR
ncbi:histidine kinase [Kibdelosporangium aridum]|uniref:Histidine kinase n=1 Tax=Kibdelosporangium aridum TaxID=2030 RepID=A0A428ZF19_KIBAR|nr:histidine kinase [Kibdelosporangium aridum]